MLNNREMASVIVLGSALAMVCLWPGVRRSFVSVLASLFGRKLMELWLLYGLSVSAAALVLDRIGLRYPGSVKDVVVWAVIAGLPIYVRFVNVQEHPDLLLHGLLKTVRATAFVEFFVNLYVFPLWIEIPVQCVILIVAVLSGYANADTSTPQVVRTFLARVLLLIGGAMLLWSAAHVLDGWHHISWKNTAFAFVQPVALTVVAVIMTAVVAVLAAHETAWTRLQFPRVEPRLRLRHQLALLFGLHVRLHKVAGLGATTGAELKATESFAAALGVVRRYGRSEPSLHVDPAFLEA